MGNLAFFVVFMSGKSKVLKCVQVIITLLILWVKRQQHKGFKLAASWLLFHLSYCALGQSGRMMLGPGLF